MSSNLFRRILPHVGRDNWSADKWRRHLLSQATSQSQKDDINAMFRRD